MSSSNIAQRNHELQIKKIASNLQLKQATVDWNESKKVSL